MATFPSLGSLASLHPGQGSLSLLADAPRSGPVQSQAGAASAPLPALGSLGGLQNSSLAGLCLQPTATPSLHKLSGSAGLCLGVSTSSLGGNQPSLSSLASGHAPVTSLLSPTARCASSPFPSLAELVAAEGVQAASISSVGSITPALGSLTLDNVSDRNASQSRGRESLLPLTTSCTSGTDNARETVAHPLARLVSVRQSPPVAIAQPSMMAVVLCRPMPARVNRLLGAEPVPAVQTHSTHSTESFDFAMPSPDDVVRQRQSAGYYK